MSKREELERALETISQSLDAYIGNRTIRFIRGLRERLESISKSRHRILIALSGSDPLKHGAVAARILLYFEKVRRRHSKKALKILFVYHNEFEDAVMRKEALRKITKDLSKGIELTTTIYEESEKYLGTTFHGLVLDLVNDLKPNDVGRLTGIVEGGGIIILLTPPWNSWDTHITIFKGGLVVPGYSEPRHNFITWFKRKLVEHKNIFIYDIDSSRVIYEAFFEAEGRESDPLRIPAKSLFPRELYELALTNDQVNVINSMEWLYEKPKKGEKKVILVTADRGRGKSCAVGIGLIGLARELSKIKHRARILITAPDISNVQSLMELSLRAAEELRLEPKPIKKDGKIIEIQGKKFSIEYWEPARIPELSGDVVAVDEASGIHVPLLHKIWAVHDRLVFAATIHGYEGAGRGFSVRFLSAIKKDEKTHMKTISMEEPIRYGANDPIERWLFDALLLDAEPAELDDNDIQDIKAGALEYLKLEPEHLFREGEQTLRQLFGIYVLAHYRNEPDDLGLIADAPHHVVRAVRTRSGKIVSAIQIAVEGGLDEELSLRLVRGEKIQGNIIPDRLLKHVRLTDIGSLKGWRIVRIATHPQVQGMGIGSRALKFVEEEARELGLNWVGSGFGVNEQLLRFWMKNGYRVVHLSPDRNPVSGEYTALVIKGLDERSQKIIDIASREFKSKLLNSLHDTYRDLEPDIARQILSQPPPGTSECESPLDPIQRDRLWAYLYSFMTYEAVNDIVYKIFRNYWISGTPLGLNDEEERVAICKVLQGNTWESVEETLGVKMHRALTIIKEAVRKIAVSRYEIKEDEKIGLSLKDFME